MGMKHSIVHEFDRGNVTTRLACESAPGDDCRLTGGPDCDCEEWTVERDDQGPFHRSPGGDVHRMVDGGHCGPALFINESVDPGEANPTGQYTIAAYPVTLRWDGDTYWWTRDDVQNVAVLRLARTLFAEEYGHDWDDHKNYCTLSDCQLKDLALEEAQRYADILAGKDT